MPLHNPLSAYCQNQRYHATISLWPQHLKENIQPEEQASVVLLAPIASLPLYTIKQQESPDSLIAEVK